MMHRDSVSSRTCFLSLAALFAASTALWAPGVAQAATTVLSTGVDTYVDSFEPTTYFGDPLEPGTGNPAEASGIPGGDGYYGMKWDTNIGATSSPNESLLWFDIPPRCSRNSRRPRVRPRASATTSSTGAVPPTCIE